MIRFSFEGTKVELPTEWEEMQVKHFCNPYYIKGQTLGILSALSGIPIKDLANSTKDLQHHFDKAARFIIKKPEGWLVEKPETLTLLGKEIPVPQDIEVAMFGQKIMYQEVLSKNEFNIMLTAPDAIAIYFAPAIYPDDWFERIEEVKEAVLELPIQQVGPIVLFFLNNTHKLLRSGKRYWIQSLMQTLKIPSFGKVWRANVSKSTVNSPS